MSKRILSNLMLMSMLAGASTYSMGTHKHHESTRCKSVDEIAGHEHKGKSQSRLAYKKSLEQKRKLRKRKGHKHGGAKK